MGRQMLRNMSLGGGASGSPKKDDATKEEPMLDTSSSWSDDDDDLDYNNPYGYGVTRSAGGGADLSPRPASAGVPAKQVKPERTKKARSLTPTRTTTTKKQQLQQQDKKKTKSKSSKQRKASDDDLNSSTHSSASSKSPKGSGRNSGKQRAWVPKLRGSSSGSSSGKGSRKKAQSPPPPPQRAATTAGIGSFYGYGDNPYGYGNQHASEPFTSSGNNDQLSSSEHVTTTSSPRRRQSTSGPSRSARRRLSAPMVQQPEVDPCAKGKASSSPRQGPRSNDALGGGSEHGVAGARARKNTQVAGARALLSSSSTHSSTSYCNDNDDDDALGFGAVRRGTYSCEQRRGSFASDRRGSFGSYASANKSGGGDDSSSGSISDDDDEWGDGVSLSTAISKNHGATNSGKNPYGYGDGAGGVANGDQNTSCLLTSASEHGGGGGDAMQLQQQQRNPQQQQRRAQRRLSAPMVQFNKQSNGTVSATIQQEPLTPAKQGLLSTPAATGGAGGGIDFDPWASNDKLEMSFTMEDDDWRCVALPQQQQRRQQQQQQRRGKAPDPTGVSPTRRRRRASIQCC